MQQALFESAAGPSSGPLLLADADIAHWPLDPSWARLREQFVASPAGQSLAQFLAERLATGAQIYPPLPFQALRLTPLPDVRVVILGQDPYHGPGQAHGLAFSVLPGQRPPPSLRNIFKEIQRDLAAHSADAEPDALVAHRPGPSQPNLNGWAAQGVLLLNTCLTVEDAKPGSHAGRGWEAFTDSLIKAASDQPRPVVFMLWGAHAQTKRALIDPARHLVLMANHPSPLSASRPPAPFLGCGHFGQANRWLRQSAQKAICW